MVRWWITLLADDANATDWQDWDRTAVSYFSRSRNDTNKKQMTNTSKADGVFTTTAISRARGMESLSTILALVVHPIRFGTW